MAIKVWRALEVCALVALAVLSARAGQAPFSYESTPGELPKTICPLQYTIRIEPDLEKFTTRGTETVEILVMKPTTEIVMNALDMDVT